MRESRLGQLWFWLSFFELLYIYKMQIPILRRLGRTIVCDRHAVDSLIDYQILLGVDLHDSFIGRLFCNFERGHQKFFLKITLEESIERCRGKWEPFPDSDAERRRRFKIYADRMHLTDYIVIDAMRPSSLVFEDIAALINRGNL